MTAAGSSACLWCERPFKPRHGGGSRQIFCGIDCRHHFHRSARQWAEGAVAAGVLTVADLQAGPGAACTLAEEGKSPVHVPEEGTAAALLDELLDVLPVELVMPVLPADTLARIRAYLKEPVP